LVSLTIKQREGSNDKIDKIFPFIDSFPQLLHLDLSAMDLMSSRTLNLKNLMSLRHLNLEEAKINLKHVKELIDKNKYLTDLNLSSINFATIKNSKYSDLEAIFKRKILWIQLIGSLPFLEQLIMKNCDLIDRSTITLLSALNLKRLTISLLNIGINDSQRDQLKLQYFPDCTIQDEIEEKKISQFKNYYDV